MPPKRIAVQPARRGQQPKGYFSSIYHGLTSEENASVVISVALFGVSVLPGLQPQRVWEKCQQWNYIVFGLFRKKLKPLDSLYLTGTRGHRFISFFSKDLD